MGTRVNVDVELVFALKQQVQLSQKGLFYDAYTTRILKNMQEFPEENPKDEVRESYPITNTTLRQWGIPKIGEGDDSSQEDDVKDETTKQPEELTKDVRKLKKKNKSLKSYIGSIVVAFAKKLKFKLLDCISSSSSSDGDGA